MVVRWANEGHLLAVGTKQGKLQLWDVANRRQLKTWQLPDSAIQSIAFSPDSTRLALEGRDRSLTLGTSVAEKCSGARPTQMGQRLWPSRIGGSRGLSSRRMEPRLCASAVFGMPAMASRKKRSARSDLRPFKGLRRPLYGLGRSSSSHRDTRRGTNVRPVWCHADEVQPRRKYLGVTRALFGQGATLLALEGDDHIQLAPLGWCFAIDFSAPTGDIAVSAKGQSIQLFNPRGDATRELSTPGVENCSLSFSADGRYLAAVGANDRVRIWAMDGK
jgi:WD40 repeat protein